MQSPRGNAADTSVSGLPLNYRYLLSGLLLSLLGSLCHAQSICITNGEWPPYMGKDLPDYGPVSAIIEQAFALEGIEVHWQFYPWARAMLVAENGQCDGTAVWSSSKQRRAAFYFSQPILNNQTHFLYRKSQPFDWKSIEDLHGLVIGGTIGYDYGVAMQTAERNGQITLTRLPSEKLGIRMLLAGRLDIFPIDKVAAQAMLRQDFNAEQRASLAFHPLAIRTDPLYLLLSRKVPGNQKLLKHFNHGLQRLKDSGAYDSYMRRIETE